MSKDVVASKLHTILGYVWTQWWANRFEVALCTALAYRGSCCSFSVHATLDLGLLGHGSLDLFLRDIPQIVTLSLKPTSQSILTIRTYLIAEGRFCKPVRPSELARFSLHEWPIVQAEKASTNMGSLPCRVNSPRARRPSTTSEHTYIRSESIVLANAWPPLCYIEEQVFKLHKARDRHIEATTLGSSLTDLRARWVGACGLPCV